MFVGDLSSEVTEQVLLKAFQPFGNIVECRVIWDANTGKSRGYGFVVFADRAEADTAINRMNGEFLGNKAIKVHWASTQRNDEKPPASTPAIAAAPASGVSYEFVLTQSPSTNTTVYVGNITPDTTRIRLSSSLFLSS